MVRLIPVMLLVCFVLPAVSAQGDKKELKIEGKLTAEDPKDKQLKLSPSRVHDYKMSSGKIYVIELQSKDFDSFLRLEDAAGKQVNYNDDARQGTYDSRIVHKSTADGVHKIIVTNYDSKPGQPKLGAYVLTVREGTQEELDTADPFHQLIGKPAPEIAGAFSFNGETKKLSDLKGKVVLVDFWAVWCGPCIQTFPHLQQWDKEHKSAGLEILGVTTYFEAFAFDKEKGQLKRVGKPSEDRKKLEGGLTPMQEHEMLRDFAGYHKLSHRIMAVSQENWLKAAKDFRIEGIPHAALIDRKGNIRMVRVGAGPENAEDLHGEIKKLLAEK